MAIDVRQFNIQGAEGHYLCLICGFPNFSRSPAYDKKTRIDKNNNLPLLFI